MTYKLTDEEILEAFKGRRPYREGEAFVFSRPAVEAIEVATRKKLLEYQSELCDTEGHEGYEQMARAICGDCWQSLLAEHEEGK